MCYYGDGDLFMIIKASVNDCNNLLYRKIEVKNDISLSDLTYYVLSAFDVDEYYDFYFEKDQMEYPYDYSVSAIDFLPCTLIYDFEEQFEIELEIEDGANGTSNQLIGGRGYGLWLGMHDFMDLYYTSLESFLSYCEENELDLENFPIGLDFDYETVELMFEENYLMIKDVYEDDGFEG